MSIRLSRPAWLSIALCSLFFATNIEGQTKKERDLTHFTARLIVEDGAGLFGHEAIRKAKSVFAELKDHHAFEMEIISLRELSESRQKEFDKMPDSSDRERLFTDLAREEARLSHARGVFVLICRKPEEIKVLCDRETKDKGFTSTDEQRVRDALIERFREASKLEKEVEKQALRDKGLLNAAEIVRDAYKKMVR